MKHRLWIALATFCLVPLLVAADSTVSPKQVVEVGHVRLTIEPWKAGVSIACDGVDVSRGSGLIVTKPPWAPHYYLGPSEPAVRGATREKLSNGERITLKHDGEHGAFTATETFTISDDGRIEQLFEGVFQKPDAEALIQWQIAGLNPTLIIGRPYRAAAKGKAATAGTVPVVAKSAEADASALCRNIDWIEFDSRIGPIRIDVDTAHNSICYDHRGNRWADATDPRFWFGDLGTRFKSGEKIRYRVVYSLPSSRSHAANSESIELTATARPQDAAQTWPQERPVIIPTPKSVEWTNHTLVYIDLHCAPHVASNDPVVRSMITPAITEFENRFEQLTGRRFGGAGSWNSGVHFSKSDDLNLPVAGYTIDLTSRPFSVQARDTEGFRNAARTLVQLVRAREDGQLTMAAVKIRDWPSLPYRGVHLFTGGKGPELHQRLIRDVISALKMNHLVLEAEYIEWDGFPEIHHPEYGMPKAEVRQLLQTCRELGVEVTPLINTLGHAQWMFTGENHLDLAEDPEAKWAYCVTNPKTYDFVFKIFEETLELFQPKTLHIGHDEFADRGRLPFRESSKPFTVEQLLIDDTLRLHAWLKERGVRTAMWGDMLLAQGEAPDACNAKSKESAAKLREALPDDILITDWHYAGDPPERFTSLTTFQAEGHETVASVWNRPANILNFARAAANQKSLGLLQTTWAGYSLDPVSFERELPQYMAYVLAAEAAWNADQAIDAGCVEAGEAFLSLMGMSSLKPANRTGRLVNLQPIANFGVSPRSGAGWFSLGPDQNCIEFFSGNHQHRGIWFDLPRAPQDLSVDGRPPAGGFALAGRFVDNAAYPQSVVIRGLGSPQTLAMLHSTGFAGRVGEPVATLEARIEGGASATLELLYGRHVFAYSDLNAAADAPIVWRGQTNGGTPIAVRALLWDLPAGSGRLESLTIRSAGAVPSLVVFALTELDAPAK
ncbi:MAG: family 20 glycosylhydrolase [Phycisphaerae bacterium]|nr:family 20 glycosylhydrolase [Phycisphaerae bacterium]